MKALKCAMCGSNDVVKPDGMYARQYCEIQYRDEAVMKGDVSSIRPFHRLMGIALLLCVALFSGTLDAAVIQHNIGTNNLIISGNSTDEYVVTGSTTTHYIEVGLGYHGSITLRNCSFNFSGHGIHSPIRIVGKDGQSNDNPLTIVDLILEGNNTIQNNGGGRACIQVDQGTQINISAIDPCDNNSGVLIAKQVNDGGGAAIGSLNHSMNQNEPTATALLYNQNGTPTGGNGTTAGGNVVISSGMVTARGGHGAGIGGGFRTYYDGMIVVYGGVVEATADFDAAGIGSGCPEGTGVIQVFAPNSAVIALPPAVISAKGAGASPSGGVGHGLFSELGLAGTKVRVYIGDPNMTSCPIHVYTEDRTPEANIYVDLSQDPDISRVVNATIDPDLFDINQVFFGTTDSSGMYSTTGKLQNNTTFFTDAISISPSSYGHPFLPQVAILPSGGNVQLGKLMADFRIESFPSTLLGLGYSLDDAREKATCVKIVYNDANPIVDVQFDLANGVTTDFDSPIFLAADSSTVISPPTVLAQGETYFVIIPIKTEKDAYVFSDVFRIIGVWHGSSTSYIRQIVTQIVGDIHAEYICEGDSYLFNGEELTEEGVYSNVSSTTSQCQALSHVEVVNLIVIPITNFIDDIGCDKYILNDIEYNNSGQYQQLFQSQFGCDSIVILNLDMDYTPMFQIIGNHYPIAGTEEAYTLYEYEIEFLNPMSHVDSVCWTLSCHNGFDLQPVEGGLKANLYLYAYSLDSIEVKAYVFNRCGAEEYSFWFHTSYYGLAENEASSLLDVFPNPNNGEFTLCLHDMEGLIGLKVVDFMGVPVLEKEIKCEKTTQCESLNLKGYPNGIYILMVNYQGKSYIKKCLISQ